MNELVFARMVIVFGALSAIWLIAAMRDRD